MTAVASTSYADHSFESLRGQRVIVTGGLGFVGSNLARRLVHLGANVLLLDSLVLEYRGNLFNIAGSEDRVTVNISDVRDAERVADAIGRILRA
jgi:UDP-glucose 4-epimerase